MDCWVYWLAGLWDADRGSMARGVVSVKNESPELLAGFIVVSMRSLGVDIGKFRVRITRGYSEAIDVYYTSMRIRRLLEHIVSIKENLRGNAARAFLAGKIDGDGYVSHVKREIYIGYGLRNMHEAYRDAHIVSNLSIKIFDHA